MTREAEMTGQIDLKMQMERVALELIKGRGAHADPIACVEDLPAQFAIRKPAGFEHSILEILAHVNYWMRYDLKRMRGRSDPYPEHAAESWLRSEEVQARRWPEEVEKFRELLQELAATCQSDERTWLVEAPAMCVGHQRNASSIGAMIFQSITHNSYHIGQIVDLRRTLGAWPPAKGGDTW
jgi:uncharacterized damage-inducible protein DinB